MEDPRMNELDATQWLAVLGLDDYGIKPEYLEELATKVLNSYSQKTLEARRPVMVFKDNKFYKASIYIPNLVDDYLQSKIKTLDLYEEAAQCFNGEDERRFRRTVSPNKRGFPYIANFAGKQVLYPGDVVIHDYGYGGCELVEDAINLKTTIIDKSFLAKIHAASHALGLDL